MKRAMPGGDERRYISTNRAADALGVSVSTIKRWVDRGILPADRTIGGHRKMLQAEVLALARQGVLPHRDLAVLGAAPSGAETLDRHSTVAPLLAALKRGDSALASAVIRRIYHSGSRIASLADDVVAPLMAKVGHEWQSERIDVWHEHRGTQIVAAALYALKGELGASVGRKRPLALGGAPAGDPYLLASLLAQLVLLDAGWEAVNLGPNTPMASLAAAMRELRPNLVWLSVSHLATAADFLPAYREFYRSAEELEVPVAVGGQALSHSIRAAMPYTTYGDGLKHLAAFARTLHRRPKLRRRGRPSRH
jgi:excisionase family DNA binding protein